ncbi:MAG: helix-turn-helix domain-containing protein [Oscillospiraceae bacterium]|nr:helix-turn-helix domain-containing protein [Oscillospiraceae bacterium]
MSTVFRVEKSGNFTVMSNYHLKDRRLSYKAKGLLSVMLSLPPDWDYTLGGLAVIANDGAAGVRSAVRELERYGYLVRVQLRDERGRMSVNEYAVYESPELNPNFSPELDTEHGQAQREKARDFFVSPSSENPPTDNPPTEKPTRSTYNKLNTYKSKTQISNHSSSRASRAEREDEDRIFCEENNSVCQSSEYYRDVIRGNIDYDFLYENRENPVLKINIDRIDELISIMASVLCSRKKTVRVNGEELPLEDVKRRFLELDRDHIDYVLTALDRSSADVRNMRAYLITALYNAPDTMESYYEAWVKRELRGKNSP